eukprot:NODE_325_length_9674_cov_0.932846.p4 type:complete len:339 gc:universal NODE_325_length_9674_cov_0.932846:7785-8801(+)
MTLPFATRKDKVSIDKAYQRLQKWISESLDNIKVELQRTLYPLFAYSYLKLIASQNTEVAKKLMELAKMDHKIDEFLSINDQQHLQESGLFASWMDKKYEIQISRFAFELLINFMDEHSMIFFLTILNSNIKVNITDKPKMEHDADASHQSKVYLGASILHEDEMLAKKIKYKDEEVSNPFDQKQKQLELQQDRPAYDRVPQPPLTHFDLENEIEELRDLKRMMQVTNRYLPSICCYTLHNTNNETSCAKLNDDITILAAGFRKSTIKLWSLNDSKLRALLSDPDPNATEIDQVLDQGTTERELVGHSGPVYDIEFSRDKKFMLSCSQDASSNYFLCS